MSDQPEALRLADALEFGVLLGDDRDAAAACLRRQHAEIESLTAQRDALRAALAANMPAVGMGWIDRAEKAEAERDALRALLREVALTCDDMPEFILARIYAAIDAAREAGK